MGLIVHRTTEAELIEGCRQGDAQAQKRLYDRYAPRLFGVCCRYVKDRMQAEDVWIAAFAKILQRVDQYSGEGSFEGWMRRVVVNESLTHLRKQRSVFLPFDTDHAPHPEDTPTGDDTLAAEDLLKMIDALPEGYRIVFNLYAIEGYSHKEIAERLGIQENTSKSQLSRARAALQQRLATLEQRPFTKQSSP
ncbi:MAG: RNA polymerase sigma factor [Cyclobacteriaceae bacterium]|jgi:RNA polymerase sigma-70 factor (ECF subfamily)|nr:RNA polymerase sigma factor [Cyclobacteriaceae bacterium]